MTASFFLLSAALAFSRHAGSLRLYPFQQLSPGESSVQFRSPEIQGQFTQRRC